MEAETIEGTVELATNEERCWPTHHDYQQAHGPEGGLPLMFCRLCGDVLPIKLPED